MTDSLSHVLTVNVDLRQRLQNVRVLIADVGRVGLGQQVREPGHGVDGDMQPSSGAIQPSPGAMQPSPGAMLPYPGTMLPSPGVMQPWYGVGGRWYVACNITMLCNFMDVTIYVMLSNVMQCNHGLVR